MVLLWWTLSCRQSYHASDVISREQAGPAHADQLSPWLPTAFVRLICQQKTLASISNQSGAQSEDLAPGKPPHLLNCSSVSSSLTGVVLSSRVVGRPQHGTVCEDLRLCALGQTCIRLLVMFVQCPELNRHSLLLIILL